MERSEEILLFWFGPGESADLPTKERTRLWFSGEPKIDELITKNFADDLLMAIDRKLDSWSQTPRSTLALIILYDQFSRNIYRGNPKAYAQDEQALQLCLAGLKQEQDQHLSLIERVFFYLPLEHSENLSMQVNSVNAFESLLDLALPETQPIFQTFYDYAIEHYETIERFGRFPYRNKALGRESTIEELKYLNEAQNII